MNRLAIVFLWGILFFPSALLRPAGAAPNPAALELRCEASLAFDRGIANRMGLTADDVVALADFNARDRVANLYAIFAWTLRASGGQFDAVAARLNRWPESKNIPTASELVNLVDARMDRALRPPLGELLAETLPGRNPGRPYRDDAELARYIKDFMSKSDRKVLTQRSERGFALRQFVTSFLWQSAVGVNEEAGVIQTMFENYASFWPASSNMSLMRAAENFDAAAELVDSEEVNLVRQHLTRLAAFHHEPWTGRDVLIGLQETIRRRTRIIREQFIGEIKTLELGEPTGDGTQWDRMRRYRARNGDTFAKQTWLIRTEEALLDGARFKDFLDGHSILPSDAEQRRFTAWLSAQDRPQRLAFLRQFVALWGPEGDSAIAALTRDNLARSIYFHDGIEFFELRPSTNRRTFRARIYIFQSRGERQVIWWRTDDGTEAVDDPQFKEIIALIQ